MNDFHRVKIATAFYSDCLGAETYELFLCFLDIFFPWLYCVYVTRHWFLHPGWAKPDLFKVKILDSSNTNLSDSRVMFIACFSIGCEINNPSSLKLHGVILTDQKVVVVKITKQHDTGYKFACRYDGVTCSLPSFCLVRIIYLEGHILCSKHRHVKRAWAILNASV